MQVEQCEPLECDHEQENIRHSLFLLNRKCLVATLRIIKYNAHASIAIARTD
jgi:hypothetical protein